MDHTNNPNPRPDYLDQLLLQHLRALLPQIGPAALEALRAQMSWVELAGGATLMSQGEPGDAMYLLVSGRLRAYIAHDDSAPPRAVRDISRGQVVGEMSLYTDEPRSATLVAVRDSVLARRAGESSQSFSAAMSRTSATGRYGRSGRSFAESGS